MMGILKLQISFVSILLEFTVAFAIVHNNCFTSSFDQRAIINKWPAAIEEEIPSSRKPLSYGSTFHLLWNNNCQGSSLFMYNGLIYLSTSSHIRESYSLVMFPETVLQGSSEVMSIAFASSHMLVVIEGRLLIYYLNSKQVVNANGIAGNVTNVASFQCCYSKRKWCQDKSNIVVAYNKIQMETSQLVYYISYDAGLHFQVQNMSASHQGRIFGASLIHSHSEIVFLVKATSATAQFVHKSYTNSNRLSEESLEFAVEGEELAFIHLHSGIDSLLAWDSKRIFYSISSGGAVLIVDVLPSIMSKENIPAPVDHQQVMQVVSDDQRSFAMLLNGSKIIYGREGIKSQAVELDVMVPANGTCRLEWADSIHLSIICPNGNQNSSVVLECFSTVINIQEHMSLMETASVCPHQTFDGDFDNDIFYLDIGMAMNITAIFIPERWQQNWFVGGVSNPRIISVQYNTKEEDMLATGLSNISLNAQIDLVASSLPNGQKEVSRGTSALWMTVMNTSLGCPQNPVLVTQIIAGCPPNKNIRVRNDVTSCDEMKGLSYVIKREHYDSSFLGGLGDTSNQEDLTISYDYAKLGCPVKEYYGDKFKPKIDLYHDDIFVEEVLVDYVLHEVHGVFTYGYTKTAAQVGCISAPQSWTYMLLQQDRPDPTTAWTRKNYQSCFLNGSELIEPQQAYEVLSNSTSNTLYWDDYNTIYVFRVTVVDPDYSFCDLSTEFAVQVYGALPKAATPPLRIVIGTCGLGLGILAGGFIVHRYKVRGEGSEEEQMDQNQ